MPECPNGDHLGSRVVRNGTYAAGGRQRYRCHPANGDPPHTFSDFNPATLAGHSVVPGAHLRRYRHSVAVIAKALVSIGRGASYRQAALNAGLSAGANGQLVADWVEMFAPVVAAPSTPRHWPPSLAAASLRFRHDGRCVLITCGWPPASATAQPWELRSAPGESVRDWLELFAGLTGAPQQLMVRRGSPAAAAALRRWADDPPALVESPRRAPDVVGHGGPAELSASLDACRMAVLRRLAARNAHFTDRRRLDLLLSLIRMDLNGEADVDEYALRILSPSWSPPS